MATPQIVSFYTKNTIYEKEIEDFSHSTHSLGVKCYIEEREDLGDWQRNCCQKPRFILECLERFQRPLLWIDSDGILLQRPDLSMEGYDFGFYFNDFEQKYARSATIYVGATQEAADFLKLWDRSCQKRIADGEQIPYADQGVLPSLLRDSHLKLGRLPLGYARIFDRDALSMEETVILHFQASRTALMEAAIWKELSGSQIKAIRMGNSIVKKSLRDSSCNQVV